MKAGSVTGLWGVECWCGAVSGVNYEQLKTIGIYKILSIAPTWIHNSRTDPFALSDPFAF
jgi:hypothetical protein